MLAYRAPSRQEVMRSAAIVAASAITQETAEKCWVCASSVDHEIISCDSARGTVGTTASVVVHNVRRHNQLGNTHQQLMSRVIVVTVPLLDQRR
jgi:hypothetical protein